jgi:LysM repeat protein
MRTFSRFGYVLLMLGFLFGVGFSSGAAQSIATPRAATPGSLETPVPVLPLVTVTPGVDGQVIHVVQYGQTLVTIAQAYGITVPELKQLNQLQNDVIYVGDKLVIRAGVALTATGTATKTATATRRPTSTPRPRTPTPTITQTPTVTPTPKPTSFWMGISRQVDQKTVGIGLIVFCAAGLVLVGIAGFRGKK